jgi:hypothetical protein
VIIRRTSRRDAPIDEHILGDYFAPSLQAVEVSVRHIGRDDDQRVCRIGRDRAAREYSRCAVPLRQEIRNVGFG